MIREQGPLTVTQPLDLRLLPDDGLEIDETLPKAWLDEKLSDPKNAIPMSAGGDGHATVEISPMGSVPGRPPIRIHGALNATVATTCVRCLEAVEEALEVELDVTLFPDVVPDRKGAEGEDESGEMDEGSYAGNELDLPGVVSEALVLELPMNPVCPDESACTERTAQMIAEANRSAAGVIPDRWAALRALVPEDKQ
jgi:hypothetical protein